MYLVGKDPLVKELVVAPSFYFVAQEGLVPTISVAEVFEVEVECALIEPFHRFSVGTRENRNCGAGPAVTRSGCPPNTGPLSLGGGPPNPQGRTVLQPLRAGRQERGRGGHRPEGALPTPGPRLWSFRGTPASLFSCPFVPNPEENVKGAQHLCPDTNF